MRIGLVNMDPVVAKEIADRLCSSREQFISKDIQWTKPKRRDHLDDEDTGKAKRKRPSTSEQNYTLLMRKRRDDMVAKRTFYSAAPSLLIGITIGVALWILLPTTVEPRAIVSMAPACLISLTGICFGRAWANQASQRRALNYEVMLEELKAVLPFTTLTRAERVYCDILVMLSDFEANQQARKAIRSTLKQLNDLLADSRRLEKQRKSLLPALGSSPVNELTEERHKLEERIAKSTDDITQGSLKQSLGHIDVRIENSRNLDLALERINAQQEAIINALASSQGALARMQVAPSIQTDTAAQEITETVAEMNRRTVAVEEAVKEVLTLR